MFFCFLTTYNSKKLLLQNLFSQKRWLKHILNKDINAHNDFVGKIFLYIIFIDLLNM